MIYKWEILRKETSPEGETIIAFNCTGENNQGINWTYFGVRTLNVNIDEEIIEELDQDPEIKIRIKKEVKKLTNPENYELWRYLNPEN